MTRTIGVTRRSNRSGNKVLARTLLVFLAALATTALPLEAQSTDAAAPDQSSFEDIVVVGLRNPERMSADDLKRAYAAYRRWRPSLAPSGQLFFAVSARAPGSGMEGLKMRVVDTSGEIARDLPLNGGRFSLPELDYASGRYSLQANRKSGSLSLEIVVLSPGTSDDHRRLGDLRLQCRVWWAVAGRKVPFPVKAMLGAGGSPCTSTKFGYFTRAPKRISTATLVTASGRLPLKVLNDGVRYRAPVYNMAISNGASVELALK